MTNLLSSRPETDLTAVCNSFPDSIGIQIPRQNIILTIERTLKSGIDVLSVEGPEGIGKTTLLSQFALAHRAHTFSLFLKATSRFAYDPEILLRDLYNQMNYAVNDRELTDEEPLDDGLFRRLITKLQQKARLKRISFYFVVDGLETIPKEQLVVRDVLLSMLPFGFSSFRFVISGDASDLLKGRRLSQKSLLLPSFTFDETLNFFADINPPRELVEKLFLTYDGFPVVLASAKRILQSGVSSIQLLEDLRKATINLFEVEWSSIPSGTHTLGRSLSKSLANSTIRSEPSRN